MKNISVFLLALVMSLILTSAAFAQEGWPSNKYTALVPRPEGVEIISVRDIDSSRRGGCEIYLAQWPLEQSKAYAQKVQQAGFTEPLNPGWALVTDDAKGWKFARMPLVAFNVNLATSDVEIAKKIAKVIRASSGGFKCCKAMGFMLEDRGIAQVSMNMVNYEVTTLPTVYEQIKSLAEPYGTYIVGSELVGLCPGKALLDCAEYYLKLENFDAFNQVMEYHLIGME